MTPNDSVVTESSVPNYHQMADPELIAACLQNDQRAWDALVLRYSRLIYATAIKSGLSPEDAGDVFQHVCITLLRQLSTLRDHTRLGAWLITLTRRKCYRLWMLRQPHLVSVEQIQENDADIPDTATPPLERELLVLERQHQIRQAIERLGEKCQNLIRHLYYEESALSHQQVAEILSVAPASIGRMRDRCLKKLKAILVERGFK